MGALPSGAYLSLELHDGDVTGARPLAVAVAAGTAVGVGVYVALLPDWFVALGTAAVYAGCVYLYRAFDVSLGDATATFDDRSHRLGQAVGLFGLAVGPLAFAHHYGAGRETVAFLLWFSGVVAFLLLLPRARTARRSAVG
jgi:uncharacterized membrane protein YfcA